MRPNWNQLVPGLAEARAAEEAARAIAFLDAPQTLLGVEVNALTLRAEFELIGAGNMLMAGVAAPHPVIAAFLWRVSLKFCRGGTLRWYMTRSFRRKLKRHVDGLDPFLASVTIRNWIAKQHQDCPPKIEEDAPEEQGDKKKKPAKEPTALGYVYLASWVDFFAEAYGWSEDETIDRPVARIWQLYRANCHRKGVTIPLCPPSDGIRRQWVVSMLERKRQQQQPAS